MASRETSPLVPSPYDPGAGGNLPARSVDGGSPGTSSTTSGKQPWNSPPDVVSLLRALGRHWVKALLLGLFLGSLGAGLTWFTYAKPKYHATASIEVKVETPTNLPGAVPIGGEVPFGVYIQTEMERFRWEDVLDGAIALLDMDEHGIPQGGESTVEDPAAALAASDETALTSPGSDPSRSDAENPASASTEVATSAGDSQPGSDSARAVGTAQGSRVDKFSAIFGGALRKDWLRENLEITHTGNIIQVTLRSEEPHGLDQVVNAVAEAYIADNKADRVNQKNTLNKLKEKGEFFESQLESYRKKLQELTEQGQDPNDPRTFALTRQLGLERLAELQSAYTKLKGDLKRVEAQLAGLKARQGPAGQRLISEEEIQEYFRSLGAVQELEDEIADLDERIEQVRYTSRKDNDAAIVKFQQQRRMAVASMEKLSREWRPQIIQRLQEQARNGGVDGASFANQVAALELELKLLADFKAEMEMEIQALTKQNKDFANSAAAMFQAQNDFRYADRAAERIRARLAEMEVEDDAPSRVRIANLAIPPTDRQDQKKKVLTTAMTGGGLFAASLLMVAFLEFRTRRVKAPDEVVHALGLSVVGTIPSLPDPKIRRPGNAAALPDSRWQQAFMESVDATRMLLLHMSRSENLRSVMITSANSGEGKTSLSSYLGGSLARAVKRALIVDCDLRRPAVHQVFDTPLEPGLCDLLRGEAEIHDIVRPTPIDGLFVIPAGHLNSQAMLSLTKGELGPILDWLKEQYDFVIVDAPPVLAVADTLQLSQHVDAVLFSILRDVSRMPEVYEARERLASMRVRVLGAVMSGTPLAGFGYNRRYSYGYDAKIPT